MAPEASWTLPPAAPGTNRTLYFFVGASLAVGERPLPVNTAVGLRAEGEVVLTNGAAESEMLLLQGRPIGEPVAQYGEHLVAHRLVPAADEQRRDRSNPRSSPAPMRRSMKMIGDSTIVSPASAAMNVTSSRNA